MYLIDFISALQELYDSYTVDYKELAGEPEITIDKFEKINTKTFTHLHEFKGVTPDIQIRRTYDGVFLVLTALPDRKKLKKPKVKGKK
ncbi:MAG: hypothetical protein ACXV2C_00435 [Candidatus Bathyarchaeia archaeon]